MPGAPLTLFEREEIGLALTDDRAVAWAVIARRIRRHPSTVSREFEANGGRGAYRPATAEQRSERCLRRPRAAPLARPGELRDRVITELKLGRSPEAIWSDLVAEGAAATVCVETIYAAVYAGVLDARVRDCLRMRRPRRRGRQARHPSKRPALPNIAARPGVALGADVPNRARTRYSLLITMPNGYAAADALGGPGRGPRADPRPPAPLHHLRSGDRSGRTGPPWSTATASTHGLRPSFALATRPGGAPQSPVAVVVPSRHRPRRHRPG